MSPLRLLHPESTFARGVYRLSLDYWRGQPTERIIASLAPGQVEPLTVEDDGTVMQGNTRIKALLERGYNVDDLPRVHYGQVESE